MTKNKKDSVFTALSLLTAFSIPAIAATDAPVWPTTLETPTQNPCVECKLSLIHISEPTRLLRRSRMPSSA